MSDDKRTSGIYSYYLKWKWNDKKHKFLKQYYVHTRAQF